MNQEAVTDQDLSDKSTLSNANKYIPRSHVSSVSLPEVAAAMEESMHKKPIVKIIELKPVSDGLQVNYTGDSLSLEGAFQHGLIPASVFGKALKQQKNCQGSKNVPVTDTDPCKVNSLIINCLKGNKVLMPERDIYPLSSLSQGHNSREEERQPQDSMIICNEGELKVDVSVQCDLMRSSSTLIVLGYQQRFMGLVLPHPGESLSVSTSFQVDKEIISTNFSSGLFSCYQKIAALYIPESSAVIDISSSVRNGFIDVYTAEILKTIEIPGEFPDIDKLNKEFSTWLTYIQLTAEGYNAPQSLNIKIPSPTEAKQLFISYLMMNTYMDPKSGQRILILDKQMTNMIKVFLGNSPFYESSSQNKSSLVQGIGDITDVHLEINEEPEDSQRCSPICASSANGNIGITGKRHMDDEDVHSSPVWRGFNDGVKHTDVLVDEILENGTNPEKCQEDSCRNSSHIDFEAVDFHTIETIEVCAVNGSPMTMFSSECSASYLNAGFSCSEESLDGKSELEDTIYFLKAQDDEEGFLNEATGRSCVVETVINMDLLEEQTVQESLSQSDGSTGHEKSTTSISNTTILLNNDLKESLLSSRCADSFNKSALAGDNDTKADEILKPKEDLYSTSSSTQPISVDHNHNDININESQRTEQSNKKRAAVMMLELTQEEDDSKGLESAAMIEHETRETEADLSENRYTATPRLGAPDSAHSVMMSPSSGNYVTSQSICQINKTAIQTEGGLSEALSHQQQKEDSVLNESNATVLLSNVTDSDKDQKCEMMPDQSHKSVNCAITVSQVELDVFSSNSHLFSEETGTENDINSVEDNELLPDYSSSRDLGKSIVSKGTFYKDNTDENINILPQCALLHSESEINVESTCSEEGHSASTFVSEKQLKEFSHFKADVSNTTLIQNDICGDSSENYILNSTRRFPDEGQANKKCLKETHSYAESPELDTNRISPERQQRDILRIDSNQDPLSKRHTAKSPEHKVETCEAFSHPDECNVEPDCNISDLYFQPPQLASERLQHPCHTVSTDVTDVTEGDNATALQSTDPQETKNQTTSMAQFYEEARFTEKDIPHEPLATCHQPDRITEGQNTSCVNRDMESPGLKEDKGHTDTKQTDAPNIQLQLLQVLKNVSSSQDLSVLQEVMDTLNSALGSDTQQARRHRLDSIKEEDEAERSPDTDPAVCAAESHEECKVPENTDSCKIEEVQNKVTLSFF